MFGYIMPFRPELKICEFETYKAVYCGLCKQLSSSYGPFSRLTLSYDFVFLAMLNISLSVEEPCFDNKSCKLNPFMKRPCCLSNTALDYSADVAMLLLYYKALDNFSDNTFLGKIAPTAALPFLKPAYKKAKTRIASIDNIIFQAIKEQQALESRRVSGIDAACEPTARILSAVFGAITGDENTKRILYRLGYLLGRFVYMADALDDMKKDAKLGRFNPFINGAADQKTARESATSSLYMTIAEIIKTYELLSPKRYARIIENTLALGLRHTVDSINSKEKKV